jgi:hypothetical protein
MCSGVIRYMDYDPDDDREAQQGGNAGSPARTQACSKGS